MLYGLDEPDEGEIFSPRLRPSLALVGALLFGVADSLQFRLHVLGQTETGVGAVPYEFLLMLPYLVTLVVLLFRSKRIEQPAALGRHYIKGER